MTAITGPQQDSLEILYRQHWAPLARLAWLLTGSRDIGEDIVHDAFVKVVPLLPTLDVPDQYLRRIVVNESRDHHRRRRVVARHQPSPAQPVWNPEVDETWAVVAALPDR